MLAVMTTWQSGQDARSTLATATGVLECGSGRHQQGKKRIHSELSGWVSTLNPKEPKSYVYHTCLSHAIMCWPCSCALSPSCPFSWWLIWPGLIMQFYPWRCIAFRNLRPINVFLPKCYDCCEATDHASHGVGIFQPDHLLVMGHCMSKGIMIWATFGPMDGNDTKPVARNRFHTWHHDSMATAMCSDTSKFGGQLNIFQNGYQRESKLPMLCRASGAMPESTAGRKFGDPQFVNWSMYPTKQCALYHLAD